MSEHSSRGAAWEALRKACLDRDGWTCMQCGKPLEGSDATADHVTPKAQGGVDELWNLVSLCRAHNSSKGDRTLTRQTWFDPSVLSRVS